MTGMVIVAALVIVLAVALGPAHRRRSFSSFDPARTPDTADRLDADHRRTVEEIRVASQRGPLRAARLLTLAARGQGAIPLHRRRVAQPVVSVPAKDSKAA